MTKAQKANGQLLSSQKDTESNIANELQPNFYIYLVNVYFTHYKQKLTTNCIHNVFYTIIIYSTFKYTTVL